MITITITQKDPAPVPDPVKYWRVPHDIERKYEGGPYGGDGYRLGPARERTYNQNLATRYRARDVYIGNLLGALNQIRNGTTTIMDWCHILRDAEMADAAIDALEESGIRAVFGRGTVKPPERPGEVPYYKKPFPREEVHRLRTGRLASDDRLVTMAMAILGPDWGDTGGYVSFTEHPSASEMKKLASGACGPAVSAGQEVFLQNGVDASVIMALKKRWEASGRNLSLTLPVP